MIFLKVKPLSDEMSGSGLSSHRTFRNSSKQLHQCCQKIIGSEMRLTATFQYLYREETGSGHATLRHQAAIYTGNLKLRN
jgi:hypothetical protein